jgi:MoaA/NifB/PqqE/SkfB family radical SAM enzyme
MAALPQNESRVLRLLRLAGRHGIPSMANHVTGALSLRRRPARVFSWPRFLQVEITSRCNMACAQCSRSTLGKPSHQGHMSLDLFAHVLRQFRHLQYLTLHGLGEPLMHPELLNIVREARGYSKSVSIGFNTNGVLLTPSLAQDLKEAGLNEIGISLDAATPETFRAIRGSTRFVEITENIESIAHSQKPRPQLAIALVVMQPNIRELVDFVEMAHALGVDRASFCDLSSRWKPTTGDDALAVRDISIAQEQAIKAEARAAELELPFVYTRLDDALWPGVFMPCFYLWDYPYVTWEGKLTPCCALPYAEEFSFGDLSSVPFRTLWNLEPYRRMRNELRSGVVPEICHGCHHAEDPALGHVCTCSEQDQKSAG